MISKDDNRLYRMIPLRQRNWAAMLLSVITLALCAVAAVALWASAPGSGEIWIWLTAGVMTIASIVTMIGIITGDPAWMLIALIISRQR